MEIGENIKNLRKQMNLTQDEFAKKIGISRSYLGDLENNRRNLSTETAKKISKKLGISLLYLLEGKLTLSDISLLKKISDPFKYLAEQPDSFQYLANEFHNRLLDIVEKININDFSDTQIVTLTQFLEYLIAINKNNEVEKFEQLDLQLYSLAIELRRLASDDEREKYKRSFEWLLSDIASSSVGIVKESKKIADSKKSTESNIFDEKFNPNKKGLEYLKKIISIDKLPY